MINKVYSVFIFKKQNNKKIGVGVKPSQNKNHLNQIQKVFVLTIKVLFKSSF